MLITGGRAVKLPRLSTCWSIGAGLVSQEDFAQPVVGLKLWRDFSMKGVGSPQNSVDVNMT